MVKNARVLFQWAGIALLLLLGTGSYLWYRASAGITTNKTPIPSEMSASGLVGYWTFDGADYSSATVITDKSGNSHSGTLTNSPTKTTGKWGQALDFPGSNQYVSVGAVYNGVKTVAFWVWADSTTKNIVDLNATATIDVSSGTIRGNNFTSPTIYIDGIVSSTPMIDTTGWHFVAITTGTGINASAVDIGRISTGYFDGRLDDVRMYSSELSASAVYQLYTAGNAKVNAPSEDSLSQSLRGYWKLDDGTGTNATDGSGNGNTLAMTGSPSWVTGNIGPYALDFSGSGQYLSVADPASGVLDFANGASFSLTGWFNRDTFASDHTIVAKKNDQSTSSEAGYIVWIDNNGTTDTLCFAAYGTAGYSLCSTTQFNATGWHHFAISWNDAATTNPVNIFIDGALSNGTPSGTFSSVASLANARDFRIGAESDAGVPFDGKLDDIRVYGYALSGEDVKKLYNTTAPAQPVDTSLVGHWTFDGPDIQGSTAIDRSGKGNNGTITGAVPTLGKLGQGLSFNGTSDYVSASSLSVSSFSVSLWVKSSVVPGTSENNSLVKNLERQFEVRWDFSSNSATFGVTSTGGSYVGAYLGDDVYTTNTWHHIVGTWDGTTLRTYNDGAFVESQVPGFTPDTSAGNFEIGRNNNWSGYADVDIDDVRIYSRALSLEEVINLYSIGK